MSTHSHHSMAKYGRYYRKGPRRTPALVARKGSKKAKKRALRKYKPSKLLNKLIHTAVNKQLETQYLYATCYTGVNTNSQIDGPDIHSIWDYFIITKGDLSTNRHGDDCRLTKGKVTFNFRCFSDPGQVANADLYLVLYIFKPKKYNTMGFDATARTSVASKFLRINEDPGAFTGLSYFSMECLTNSDEILLLKKKIFRVHNAIGGVTSWFTRYTYNLKPKSLKFTGTDNKPYNHNICWAYGFVNANSAIHGQADTATRVQSAVSAQIWFKQ